MIRGLSANAYDQAITAFAQVVGVPILLHAWGTRMYGEWLILFAIPAYLSMADLGFSQSASNDMTAKVARDDRTGALAVFQSLGALVFCVSMVGPLLLGLAIGAMPLQHWLAITTMTGGQVKLTLWLLTSSVIVGLADGPNQSGFRATGDYALHRGLMANARLLQFTGIWASALLGAGPTTASIVFFLARALTVVGSTILLRCRHPWLVLGLTHARRSKLGKLFKPAMANMAIPLAQAINLQGMVLVVGAYLGPVAVVVFSTLRTLTRLALQTVLAVSNTAEPELASAHGAKDTHLLQSIFSNVLRGGLWLSLLAASALYLLGEYILRHWTRNAVSMDAILFGWLLGSAVASVLWYGALVLLRATNRHVYASVVYVAASGVALLSAAAFLTYTGKVASAGMALLIMDAAMAVYTLRAAIRLLNVSPVKFLIDAINPVPLLALVSIRPRATRNLT